MTLLEYFTAISSNLSFLREWVMTYTASPPMIYSEWQTVKVFTVPLLQLRKRKPLCSKIFVRAVPGIFGLCLSHLSLKYSLSYCHCWDQWLDPCSSSLHSVSLSYRVILDSLFTQRPPRLTLPTVTSYSCECPQEIICMALCWAIVPYLGTSPMLLVTPKYVCLWTPKAHIAPQTYSMDDKRKGNPLNPWTAETREEF